MPKPVFICDTMRAETEVQALKESRSRPEAGIVTFAQRDRLPMPADGVIEEEARMKVRSLLFVPGDRSERFEKAAASGADAIILDLEDSVAPERKAFAREAIAQWLGSRALASPSSG